MRDRDAGRERHGRARGVLSADADPFGLVGQVLDGQFRVDRFVGEGGFSVVYRGHHVGLDEPIAIKCLKLPGALGSALVESFVRRFRDESRLHYRLSQGNLHIARSIASGTTMAPVTSALVPYMVLEWMEGRSLAQDFTTRRAQGMNGRPLPEVMKLLDPALDAIAYAHSQGVVHRDLNPGNLFLTTTREGIKLKVLDFGVAKIVSDHALAMGPRVQTIGQIRIFSPAYGSPEQFDDKLGKVGSWSDVYSLTLIMLEALGDRTVNEGEHIGEYAMRTLDEAWRPTPRGLGIPVGDEVEALFAQATSLIPAERPQDAGEFWGMMKNAVRKDVDSGKPPFANRTDNAPPRRHASAHAGPTVTLAIGVQPASEIVRGDSALPSGTSRPPATTLRMASTPSPAPGMRSTQPMAAVPPKAPPPQSGAWGPNSSATYNAASGAASTPPMHPSGAWGPNSSATYSAPPAQAPIPQPIPTPYPPFGVPIPQPIPTPYPPFAAPIPPARQSYPVSQMTRIPTRPPPPPVEVPRSRAMIVFGIFVFLVLLGAIAAAGYYFVLRKAPGPPAVGMLQGALEKCEK